jgi:hypothetical protein
MTLRVVRHELDRDQTVSLQRDFTKPLSNSFHRTERYAARYTGCLHPLFLFKQLYKISFAFELSVETPDKLQELTVSRQGDQDISAFAE